MKGYPNPLAALLVLSTFTATLSLRCHYATALLCLYLESLSLTASLCAILLERWVKRGGLCRTACGSPSGGRLYTPCTGEGYASLQCLQVGPGGSRPAGRSRREAGGGCGGAVGAEASRKEPGRDGRAGVARRRAGQHGAAAAPRRMCGLPSSAPGSKHRRGIWELLNSPARCAIGGRGRILNCHIPPSSACRFSCCCWM